MNRKRKDFLFAILQELQKEDCRKTQLVNHIETNFARTQSYLEELGRAGLIAYIPCSRYYTILPKGEKAIALMQELEELMQ